MNASFLGTNMENGIDQVNQYLKHNDKSHDLPIQFNLGNQNNSIQ